MALWTVKVPVLAVATLQVVAATDEEAIARARQLVNYGCVPLEEAVPCEEVVVDGRTVGTTAFQSDQ
jgi:hypothetical protein